MKTMILSCSHGWTYLVVRLCEDVGTGLSIPVIFWRFRRVVEGDSCPCAAGVKFPLTVSCVPCKGFKLKFVWPVFKVGIKASGSKEVITIYGIYHILHDIFIIGKCGCLPSPHCNVFLNVNIAWVTSPNSEQFSGNSDTSCHMTPLPWTVLSCLDDYPYSHHG